MALTTLLPGVGERDGEVTKFPCVSVQCQWELATKRPSCHLIYQEEFPQPRSQLTAWMTENQTDRDNLCSLTVFFAFLEAWITLALCPATGHWTQSYELLRIPWEPFFLPVALSLPRCGRGPKRTRKLAVKESAVWGRQWLRLIHIAAW